MRQQRPSSVFKQAGDDRDAGGPLTGDTRQAHVALSDAVC